MMDLSKLSNADIQAAIQKMQKGIDIKPGSIEATELQISIDRALEELQRRAQKKSEQPTGNPGQLTQPIEKVEELPQPGKIQQAAAKVPDEVKQQVKQGVENKLREVPEQIKNLIDSGWGKTNDVLSAPAKAAEQTIPVVLLGWKQPKEMNRSHIRAEARRYFNAVFTSAKFKTAYSEDNLSALWSMKMYCNLWALCEAYNQLAKVRFEMEDLLQNYWSYAQANQDLARELVEFLNEEQP
jgi:hypothetical protein